MPALLKSKRFWGAIAGLVRNPDNLLTSDFRTLGSAAGESLEDLPYWSRVMGMTLYCWHSSSAVQRNRIMDDLREKIALYQRFYDNPGNWISLYEGASPGEWVFAMPFSALP